MIRARQLMIMASWLPQQPKHHDHESQRAAAGGEPGSVAAGRQFGRAVARGKEGR